MNLKFPFCHTNTSSQLLHRWILLKLSNRNPIQTLQSVCLVTSTTLFSPSGRSLTSRPRFRIVSRPGPVPALLKTSPLIPPSSSLSSPTSGLTLSGIRQYHVGCPFGTSVPGVFTNLEPRLRSDVKPRGRQKRITRYIQTYGQQ